MTTHTHIGETAHGKPVSLTRDERLRHMAIFGSTGVGKTTFLLNIVAQDIARGDGLLVIDPHGDFAERALTLVPPSRNNQVCYVNLTDSAYPVGFNVLEDPGPRSTRRRRRRHRLRHARHLDRHVGPAARTSAAPLDHGAHRNAQRLACAFAAASHRRRLSRPRSLPRRQSPDPRLFRAALQHLARRLPRASDRSGLEQNRRLPLLPRDPATSSARPRARCISSRPWRNSAS